MRVNASSPVNAIVGLKAAEMLGSVQMAVAAKLLETQRDDGRTAVKLIQAAFEQMESAAAAVVSSTSIDTYA